MFVMMNVMLLMSSFFLRMHRFRLHRIMMMSGCFCVIPMMLMAVMMVMVMRMAVSVKILHIMIVIFMLRIQFYQEIPGIDPGLFHLF